MTGNKQDFSRMRCTSLFGLLLLCVNLYFVNTENVLDKTHNEQQQEISPVKKRLDLMEIQMEISPTWYLSVGDTVVINCTTVYDRGNNSHKIDLQLVWTKMGPGEKTKTVLVKQRASKGISYVLGPVTHEHQGVYTCNDDGSLPDVLINRWHRIIWVADASPTALIDVISHNRSQLFNNEMFTLSCQLPNNNVQWKMMRFNQWWGNITELPNQVSSDRRLSCTTSYRYSWSDILYWCESPTGERSNALNITTTVGVTLESPTLPVLEGEDLMLRCLHRNKTTNEITSNLKAVFYKNKRQIRIQTEGNLTLTAVTKADEGMYMCSHPEGGPSNYSWISVKERLDKDPKKKRDIQRS